MTTIGSNITNSGDDPSNRFAAITPSDTDFISARAVFGGGFWLKGDMNGLTADARPLLEDTYLGTFAYTLEDYQEWDK